MNEQAPNVPLWAIVPAAGQGRRMGRPKQTMPFGGSTMAGTVVRTLLAAGADRVLVVTRTTLTNTLDLPNDDRVAMAINDDDRAEMIDSVRIALAKLAAANHPHDDAGSDSRSPLDAGASGANAPSSSTIDSSADPAGVIVVPADMPALSVEACRRCMAAFRADPQRMVIATHAGRRGHPLVFPWSLRGAIDRLPGGLNELSRLFPDRVALLEVDDPAVLHDVDTLDDYEMFGR